MSRIDTLVAELCPDGVEYKEIGGVLNYEQPTKYLVSSKDYSDDNATPVLTAGKTFILGYTSETDGIYPASRMNPVIIFDDFTTDFKWVDFPFKAKSSGMKMLTAADENLATIRYAYHAMQAISFSPLDHKRHWIGEYSHFEIPVPPIEVQREIVCVLDSFAALTDELTDKLAEEVAARKEQYAYYRDRLLSLESLESLDGKPVEMVRLGDVFETFTGKTPKKTDASLYGSEYPFYKPGDFEHGFATSETEDMLSETGFAESRHVKPGSTLVTCIASLGKIAFVQKEGACNQQINVIPPAEDMNSRFVFHYCCSTWFQSVLWKKANHSNVPNLSLAGFNTIEIPVPSLASQQKVVDILDRFDALTTSLTDGLPAEIEARRAQYALYRDRLLDFPRKAIGTE